MQLLLNLAASGSGAAVDPFSVFIQYGALGAVVVLLAIYSRGSVTRERARSDKAEQLVKELNEFIRSEMLPRQVEATLLHKQVAEVLEEAIKVISEVKIRDSIRGESSGVPPLRRGGHDG